MIAISERLDHSGPCPTESPQLQDLLTPDKAAQFYYLSFRFAQQGDILQRHFFQYARIARPFWEMSNELRTQTEEIAFARIDRFLKHASANNPNEQKKQLKSGVIILHGSIMKAEDSLTLEDVIENQKRDTMDAFQEELNSPEIQDSDWLISQIATSMVGKDTKFILRKGRIRANVNPNSPLGNPMLSMTCYYGLAGQPTGSAVFDEMFREVAEFHRITMRSTDLQAFLIRRHNSDYPNLAINPQTLLLDQ